MFCLVFAKYSILSNCTSLKQQLRYYRRQYISHTPRYVYVLDGTESSCSYPLSSFPWPGTSGIGNTGSGSSGVCPPDSPYYPCMCSSGPSSQCAWKSPCSPRSCTRHSACLEKGDKVTEVEDFSQQIGEPKFVSVIILLLHKCYIIKSCFWSFVMIFCNYQVPHKQSKELKYHDTWLFTTCTVWGHQVFSTFKI